jgi:RNA polymerase sigma-70 factor, ECF subfamily
MRSIRQADTVVEEASGGNAMGISFEGFFAGHHADLFSALWLITRNRHETEEIVQEAFLRVWERWDRVATLDDPEGYLFRTAMNVFRSRRRRTALAVRRTFQTIPPDDGVAAVEARDMLVRALAKLTPRERAAVVLTSVLGFTSEDAGEALDIRPVTVRVLAARGRARMQKEATQDDA